MERIRDAMTIAT